MKNTTRSMLVLSVLAFTGSASAAVWTVPSQNGGFKVGIDALYFRPSTPDIDYAASLDLSLNPTNQTVKNLNIDLDHTWGFYAQVGYLVPFTGNDVTFGYTGIHSRSTGSAEPGVSSSLFPIPATTILNIILGGFPGNFSVDLMASRENFDLNVVDFEAGQRLTSGAFDLRMFAGLRYTNLTQSLSTNSTGNIQAGEFNVIFDLADKYKSDFSGLGPRLGMDGRYALKSGVGVDGSLSTALLIGQSSASYTLNYLGGFTEQADVRSANTNRVVPNIDAKLGMDYTYLMNRGTRKSALIFEAGYQVTHYFNVLQSPNIQIVGDSGAAQQVAQKQTWDVGFDGPYLGVKYYA